MCAVHRIIYGLEGVGSPNRAAEVAALRICATGLSRSRRRASGVEKGKQDSATGRPVLR
jgi:hypothetical protein